MSTKASMDKTLWEIAIDERDKAVEEKTRKDPSSLPMETNLLVCGTEESGKTSTLLRFLDRDENPKPTVALDYTFARRARGNGVLKDVCHIWELGGGVTLTKLMEIVFTPSNISKISVALILDLSRPNVLWETQEILIEQIQCAVEQAVREANKANPIIARFLKERCWKRIGINHGDKSMMEPLPIPFVIIGSKYDVYQEFEPENKRMICKTLRFLAHKNGATLQFSSNKIDNLSSRTRLILGNLAFSTNINKASITDHNKPIVVHAGQDKFDDIGAPQISQDRLLRMKSGTPYDLWREAYAEFFPPQKLDNIKSTSDPVTDKQFAEPVIDAVRAQKDEELGKYRKSLERKGKDSGASSQKGLNSGTRAKKKT